MGVCVSRKTGSTVTRIHFDQHDKIHEHTHMYRAHNQRRSLENVVHKRRVVDEWRSLNPAVVQLNMLNSPPDSHKEEWDRQPFEPFEPFEPTKKMKIE